MKYILHLPGIVGLLMYYCKIHRYNTVLTAYYPLLVM